VWQSQQASGVGACAGDRKFALEEARLPALVVRPVCGRASDRTIVASPWPEDRGPTKATGRIRHCGGCGLDSGPRIVYQLVGSGGQEIRGATGAWGLAGGKIDRAKAGRGEGP